MQSVTSRDGTTIAFDRLGDGPPVVLVCGGSTDRTADAALAGELATNSPSTWATTASRRSARRPSRCRPS
jgi:hypothetical protein